jgi:hypothetical protein
MAAEAPAGRPQDQGIDPPVSHPDATKKLEWLPILHVTAKLIGAGAVVAATVVANSYQSAMTATNMLVQREQADSNLRAGMFHDLIGPVVGPGDNKEGISVDREQLLVEMLVLNFHEHFVLKPLMMDVDNRLRRGETSKLDQAESESENARKSLRAVAHQIVQRQLASLNKAQDSSPPEQQACIYDFQIEERKQEKSEEETEPLRPCSTLDRHFTVKRYFDDLIGVDSPNGIYTRAFTISRPESGENQVFDVSMRITGNVEGKKREAQTTGSRGSKDKKQIADQDFALTWFDFPFSDNTLLSDGSRFSLVIDEVEPFLNRVKLKLVWFPQDYFAAHERPTNYREIRSKLGISVD